MLDGAQKARTKELVKPGWLKYDIKRMRRRCVDGLEITIQPRTFSYQVSVKPFFRDSKKITAQRSGILYRKFGEEQNPRPWLFISETKFSRDVL